MSEDTQTVQSTMILLQPNQQQLKAVYGEIDPDAVAASVCACGCSCWKIEDEE